MTTALGNGLRRAAARLVPAPDPIPDGELLARFLASRDEAAFAHLVRRHAGMVFGTCRRVLGNSNDADDAFQAAFVVLVRKAHSLTDRACVGNFLYGVAFHTALKARAMATKRRAKEAKATRPEPAAGGEITRVLDEELANLPDKYREPVVLCELDGVSRKDAAARLGVPEGTISSRLATAHRMLGKRLTARGFASVAVAAVLGNQAFAVPAGLTAAAVRAAADGPPAAVTQLASEVSKMLLWHKLKAGAAVLAGVLMLAGVGAMAPGFADDKPAVKAPAPAKEAKKPDDAKLLQGTWTTKAVRFDPPMPVPPGARQEHAHHTLTFTDTDLTWVSFIPSDPKTRSGQTKPFKLDTTASPKELTSGDNDCIYELDGDTLKVAMNALTPGRPKGFTAKDSPPGRGHVWVIELTREKEEADKSYTLKDGEVLKLIPAPFPDEREAVVRLHPDFERLGSRLNFDQFLMPVTIENGKPVAVGGGMSRGGRVKPDENGIRLSELLTVLLHYNLAPLSDPDWLLQSTTVDCDVLLKKGATPNEWLPALQKELKAKCGVDLVLEFRDAETDVVVISGKHTLKSVRGDYDLRKPSGASAVKLFTSEKRQHVTGRGDGTSRQLPSVLAQFLGRPVVDESDLVTNEVALGLSCSVIPHSTRKAAPIEGTPEVVFADLTKETGLTFKLEKRKVKALVVAKAKADKPEVDKSYTLKDGEVLKLIPVPFPDEREEIYTKFDAAGGINPPPPAADRLMAVTTKGGKPASANAFTNRRTPGAEAGGKPLGLFLQHALRIDRSTVLDPDGLLDSTILDADVVLDRSATAADLLAALGKELKAKCGLALELELRQVETSVVVVSGKHTLKADPPADPSRPHDGAPVVHLFAAEKQEHPDGVMCDTAALAAQLAGFLGRPVVDDSDLKKKSVPITVRFHSTHPETDKTRAADRDPAKVLKNLEEQTGLTLKLEKRTVKAVVVKKEPGWKAEFRKAYGLKEGELVRRVPLPHPDCRAKMFEDLFPGRQGNIPPEQQFTAFQWKGDWLAPQFGQSTMPVKPEVGVSLVRLLEMTLNMPHPRIEDQTTLGLNVTGDFVVRAGADPEKVAAQLEALLRKECELPVKFTFKDAEEEVFVLGGKYKLAPLDDSKPDLVEVFARYRNDGTFGGGGSGTLAEMLAAVEKQTGKRVVLGEVTGGPKKVSWHFNDRKGGFTRQEYDEDRNVAVVLGNIATQTGLEVTVEKRKVRVLVVTTDR